MTLKETESADLFRRGRTRKGLGGGRGLNVYTKTTGAGVGGAGEEEGGKAAGAGVDDKSLVEHIGCFRHSRN